jgi:hypothetical protein
VSGGRQGVKTMAQSLGLIEGGSQKQPAEQVLLRGHQAE